MEEASTSRSAVQLSAFLSVLPSSSSSGYSSSQRILASPKLWKLLLDQLLLPGESAAPDSITVSISALYLVHCADDVDDTVKAVKKMESLVCCAIQCDPAMAKTNDSDCILYAAAPLVKSHSNLFGRPRPLREAAVPTLSISVVRAIPLSSIILLSLSSAAYDLAVARSAQALGGANDFEQLVERDGGVLRSGETLVLGQGRDALKWRIAMTEPVQQGVVRKGFTRFLVLPSPSSTTSKLLLTNGHAASGDVNGHETDDEEDEEQGSTPSISSGIDDDEDDFDIDESFLANSVLAPRPILSPPASHLSSPIPQSAPLTNGHTSPSTSSSLPITPLPLLVSQQQQQYLSISAHPLSHPVASPLCIPRPAADEDDAPRLYLRMKDLGRLSIFSGDWLVVRSEQENGGGGGARLVRVFAYDGVMQEAATSALDGSIHAYLPPTTLFNISPRTVPATPLSLSSLRLSSPLFPTAHSITVARLASPHSVHRAYQSLFLDGLKRYFQSKKRILKKGDVIAVGICEEGARFGKDESRMGVEEEDVDAPISSNSPTAVVYFKITSLDLPPSASAATTTSSSTLQRSRTGTAQQIVQDELAAGELGCLVDPLITKMLQTGLERSLVPDVAGFLNLVNHSLVSTSPNRLGDPTPASRLQEYVAAALRPGASAYDLHLTVLLKGARGCGKRTIVRTVARRTGFHLLELDCFDLLGETELKTEAHLRSRIEKAVTCSPCIVLLRNLEALARKSQALETGQEPAMSTTLRDCFALARQGWKSTGFPIIVLATTCDVDKIPTGVLASFKEEINYEAPGEAERLSILRSLTSSDRVAPDVSLRALAIQTAALVAVDLVDLVRRARLLATSRVLLATASSSSSSPSSTSTTTTMQERTGGQGGCITLNDLHSAGTWLTSSDFNAALEKARSSYSESIGAPKIPNVTWDDVGGLAHVKGEILETIQLPLERPELFADGLKKRSGILLYGPPGTGKTLLAKAVATSCSLNFFSIKGPELLNMYIGESEANVRRVFQRARDAKPCVIFFDELDSVAPKRGNQGDSGGVMDRIVSQLLAELDGMAEGKGGSDVFVIGATNRPDLLDPALLRPGRFDRMLYLGVSDTHDSQLRILEALTRKFTLDPSVKLEAVAQICPFNYTGADFYALCSDAMLKAMTRVAEDVDRRIASLNTAPPYLQAPLTAAYYLSELASPNELRVLVRQEDFEAALGELVPSVSRAEMLHYATIRERFAGVSIGADQPQEVQEVIGNGEVIQGNEVVVNGKGKGKERAVQ